VVLCLFVFVGVFVCLFVCCFVVLLCLCGVKERKEWDLEMNELSVELDELHDRPIIVVVCIMCSDGHIPSSTSCGASSSRFCTI